VAPKLSFRDRFLTPRVARAITSPLGILLAGGGAAAGILLGLPVLGAAVIGAAAWAGRVAVAVPRNKRAANIDPFALKDPWRRFVQEALRAKSKYDQAVKRVEAGPLRDRLAEIGERMDAGLDNCWHVAQQGQALADARAGIDDTSTQRELAEVVQSSNQAWAANSDTQRTIESLQAQLASVKRMDDLIDDTRTRLRLLDARLDEAVARAIELSVRATDVTDLGGLGDDVESLVGDMEALRQGLEEAGGAEQAATGA
jgi:hypothetical protein